MKVRANVLLCSVCLEPRPDIDVTRLSLFLVSLKLHPSMLFEQEVETDRNPRHIYEPQEEEEEEEEHPIIYTGTSPTPNKPLLILINQSLSFPYPFPTTPLGTFSKESQKPIGLISKLEGESTNVLLSLPPTSSSHQTPYASLILSTLSPSKTIIIDFSQPPTSLSNSIESIPGTLKPPTLIVGLSASLLLLSQSKNTQILLPPRSSGERLPEIYNVAFKSLDIAITIPHPSWIKDSSSTATTTTSTPTVVDSMYI